ncbi:uncharacterized protein A1O9_04357 [Exophiala aquamarina CBS 119918]|uniref:Uncharacterized protein n=1 Tax=Exophiala aquamarina CBS 119918 TaxID=1182545 RepID=A0A072PJL4_9EURO|nr:uncharacterized protein A1O9_04357 [Exophiala aquamarina CBS 119918]KEF59513.1 hypothetical protein A1O9_04357 [Exophiala aquamarina CBS 119918]
MEGLLGIRESLSTLISRKFREAYKNKDIIFSDTSLAIVQTQNGIPVGPNPFIPYNFLFQLRYCPALAKKPTSTPTSKPQGGSSDTHKMEREDSKTEKPKFNPFANPAPELLIAQVPRGNDNIKYSHALILNKFPVIKNHFIIATKSNKPQTAVLEEDDLSMTYACLRAWSNQRHDPAHSKRLFSFFNSGEHSGASQPHRHLQFLPVEDMLRNEKEHFDLLIDHMTVQAHPDLPLYQDPALPILHFATPLEEGNLSASALHSKYVMLLRAAISAVQHPGEPFNSSSSFSVEDNSGSAAVSYNLAMTTERMAICPRRKEGAGILRGASASGPDSFVAINGTILGGTLMVKDEAEWDLLRQDPSVLEDLLAELGYPLLSWLSLEPTVTDARM